MRGDSNPLKPLSFYKQTSFFVKLLLLFLLLGLTIRFFPFHSIDYSSTILETQSSSPAFIFPETDLSSDKGTIFVFLSQFSAIYILLLFKHACSYFCCILSFHNFQFFMFLKFLVGCRVFQFLGIHLRLKISLI